jgi:SAM-dependent methyltransferase
MHEKSINDKNNYNSFVSRKGDKYYINYKKTTGIYKGSLLLECQLFNKNLMKGKLLDLGCGNKPYSIIYNKFADISISCDVPFSLHKENLVDVFCYAEKLPFKQNIFDCIICTEVLEHTKNDLETIRSIFKILKSDGYLLISVPFIYVLHEEPYDYRRYTFYGLKNLLESNGFEVKSIVSMGGIFFSLFSIIWGIIWKIFFFAFKKLGFNNLSELNLIKLIITAPEWIAFKIYKNRFRRKLLKNNYPSLYERYSSAGYFFVAQKSG